MLAGFEEFCVVYIDDIVIFSDIWEEHIQHVRQVLDRLARTGFTAKLTKCLFVSNDGGKR